VADSKRTGGGQAKVRQYKTGVIVRCSDTTEAGQCQRAIRYIDLSKSGEIPEFKCGLAPLLPKVQKRVGQQKQKK
jgi:hypothetical protein